MRGFTLVAIALCGACGSKSEAPAVEQQPAEQPKAKPTPPPESAVAAGPAVPDGGVPAPDPIASGFDDRDIGGLTGGSGTWGTIGTGRFGTIVGGGSGAVGRRPQACVPTLTIGQPQAVGDLDKAIIRRYIKRNFMKLQYCYEKELLASPQLAGTVVAQFLIAGTGSVATSNGAGVSPAVATCVANVIKGIEFPKPKDEKPVQVNYPFTFRPCVP